MDSLMKGSHLGANSLRCWPQPLNQLSPHLCIESIWINVDLTSVYCWGSL